MPHSPFSTGLYRGLNALLPPLSRLSRGRLGEQRGAAARWTAWAEAERPDGTLIWIHGASVGELLAAAPVIRRLRRLEDAPTVVSSHTSRSVAGHPLLLPTARQDYLPLDTPQDTARTLDAVRPDCLVVARGDLWPEFLYQALRRRIPIAIVGGMISARSLKLRFPVHSLYAPLVQAVSWIGAVSPGEADRWRRLGASAEAVVVTGDPRHDEVLEHVTDLRALTPYRAWSRGGPVLVAGSVEPNDLQPLLHAWRAVRREAPAARLLVVPHEPSPALIERITRFAAEAGSPTVVGPEAARSDPEAASWAIHDRVGHLRDLYALGAIAYVGGGFRRARLHSVMEPAALGIPVLTGPRGIDQNDAARLHALGGLVAVSDGVELGRQCRAWLSDPAARMHAGLAARHAIATGAADRSANALMALLKGR
jgi:3-deoxy-D-manno-octulosonic-acid transferase